jgi:hypothetical protein
VDGQVVYTWNFNGPDPLQNWSRPGISSQANWAIVPGYNGIPISMREEKEEKGEGRVRGKTTCKI